MQSALFNIVHIYLVCNGNPAIVLEKINFWIFNCYVAACTIFIFQHYIYAAQYVQVVVILPLLLCRQTPEVLKKLKMRKRINLLCISLIASTLFVCSFYFSNKFPSKTGEFACACLFNTISFIILIALCYSFSQIKKMTQMLTGIFRNQDTMFWHLSFFIGAIVC